MDDAFMKYAMPVIVDGVLFLLAMASILLAIRSLRRMETADRWHPLSAMQKGQIALAGLVMVVIFFRERDTMICFPYLLVGILGIAAIAYLIKDRRIPFISGGKSTRGSGMTENSTSTWAKQAVDLVRQEKDQEAEQYRRAAELRTAKVASVQPMVFRLLSEVGDTVWGRKGRFNTPKYEVRGWGDGWLLGDPNGGLFIFVGLQTSPENANLDYFIAAVYGNEFQGYSDEYETEPIYRPEPQDWAPAERTSDTSEVALKQALSVVLRQAGTRYNLDQLRS